MAYPPRGDEPDPRLAPAPDDPDNPRHQVPREDETPEERQARLRRAYPTGRPDDAHHHVVRHSGGLSLRSFGIGCGILLAALVVLGALSCFALNATVDTVADAAKDGGVEVYAGARQPSAEACCPVDTVPDAAELDEPTAFVDTTNLIPAPTVRDNPNPATTPAATRRQGKDTPSAGTTSAANVIRLPTGSCEVTELSDGTRRITFNDGSAPIILGPNEEIAWIKEETGN